MIVWPPQNLGVNLQAGGLPITGSPFSTLDFTGGVTVTSSGGGCAGRTATVDITGGGGGGLLTSQPLTPTANPRVWNIAVPALAYPFMLYHNGRRLELNVEYTFPGGGTTVTFLKFTPGGVLQADYVPV